MILAQLYRAIGWVLVLSVRPSVCLSMDVFYVMRYLKGHYSDQLMVNMSMLWVSSAEKIMCCWVFHFCECFNFSTLTFLCGAISQKPLPPSAFTQIVYLNMGLLTHIILPKNPYPKILWSYFCEFSSFNFKFSMRHDISKTVT